MSPFNHAVFVRTCHPGGIRLVIADELIEVDRAGHVVRADISDRRDDVLTSTFGFSDDVVASLPGGAGRAGREPEALGTHSRSE
jgi:hypothetical protein